MVSPHCRWPLSSPGQALTLFLASVNLRAPHFPPKSLLFWAHLFHLILTFWVAPPHMRRIHLLPSLGSFICYLLKAELSFCIPLSSMGLELDEVQFSVSCLMPPWWSTYLLLSREKTRRWRESFAVSVTSPQWCPSPRITSITLQYTSLYPFQAGTLSQSPLSPLWHTTFPLLKSIIGFPFSLLDPDWCILTCWKFHM